MTPSPDLTAAELDRFLEGPADPPELESCIDAAAVLATFDPVRLRPAGWGTQDPPPMPAGLLSRCEPVIEGADRGRWRLALADRRPALRRLVATEGIQAALDANPDRARHGLQRAFEDALVGRRTRARLKDLPRADLIDLLTLHEWLDGIVAVLPERAAVAAALVRFDRLAPLRRLVRSGFVGRQRELARLARFVDGPDRAGPLFVHGPGGVGKSTLLARFILDRVDAHGLRFAYIDIDRPAIRPEEPATVLLDAVSQLEPQLGLAPGTADALTSEITYATNRAEPGRALESSSTAGDMWLPQVLARALDPVLDGAAVLVVLDSFEEAQYLGDDVVGPLVQFVADLGSAVPELRFVLSGRALPDELATPAVAATSRPIDLDVLDPTSARRLLRKALRLAKAPGLRPAEIDDVIAIVGRNAMCLKLAARLLRDEGVAALRTDRNAFLTRLRAEKVQALLYGRILRHLHSDDARAVAYPGLIVRRIAPDVIREVLAGPCELELGAGGEHVLFGELANEVALVEPDPVDGSLRHRTDVRRSVLEDITDHVAVDVVERIDRGAVAFYAVREGAVARAEELYHRLRLGDPIDVLERRWTPEAAPLLRTAVEEVGAAQRLWLAAKLGVTLDPATRASADLEIWEQHAAASAQRFLAAHAAERALAVLHERRERSPRSVVHSPETEAYRLLGRFDEALAVGRRGVDAAIGAGAVDLALTHLLTMAVIEEGRGRFDAAAALLREAAGIAPHAADPLLRLRLDITELRLERRRRTGADMSARRAQLAAGLSAVQVRALRSRPVLLREVAAELSVEDPQLAAEAIETLGIEVADDGQAEAFGRAVVHAVDDVTVRLDPVFAEGADVFRREVSGAEEIRRWVTGVVSGKDIRSLGRSLGTAGDDALRGFRTYFRAGVDSSLRMDAEE